MLDDGKLWRQK